MVYQTSKPPIPVMLHTCVCDYPLLYRYGVGGRIDDPEAPALVMVHGFGGSADQWDRCFAELSSTHRLYAVDMIGFGHSSKPPLTYRCDGQYTTIHHCNVSLDWHVTIGLRV